MCILAVSLLDIDYTCLESKLREIESTGTRYIHIDVMDGAFVPNIGIGPQLVESIRTHTNLIFDVHMMVNEPIRFINRFVRSGADIISVHYEACKDLKKTLACIKKNGIKCGIALNPDTPLQVLDTSILEMVDVVHLMTIQPGIEGQSFIEKSFSKIAQIRDILDKNQFKCDIEVDGNVNKQNVGSTVKAGATIIVSGRAIVCGNMAENIFQMNEMMRSSRGENVI